MHERALVADLIRQIEEERVSRGLRDLVAVRIGIGEFAGIERALLESAFEELALARWRYPVRLCCDTILLTARCQKCEREFHVERFQFVCPQCGCQHVNVIDGEQIVITSLTARKDVSGAVVPCSESHSTSNVGTSSESMTR